MKVKTDYVPIDTAYLTVGKEYEVFDVSDCGNGGYIENDDGVQIWIHIPGSAHIGNRPWEMVR